MYSDAEITVPYSMLMKTLPEYLDGEKTVYIGFRAENISLEEEVAKSSKTKIKVRISHSEELGTETLVYGDINMQGDGFSESSTRVIIKSAGFKEYEPDSICEAALDIQGIHLFDKDTEESIMPRIPKVNTLDCEIKNRTLNFLGQTLDLPSAIQCEAGKGELILPVDAIQFGGELKAEVVDCENINGKNLISLELNGNRIYMLSDLPREKGEVEIRLDFKK